MNDYRSILLVEDSPDDVLFFREAAGHYASRLLVASDGVEALRIVLTQVPPPCVIFVDLKMPKLGGLELLRALKGNAATRTIPVVVFSSSLEKRDLSASYDLGVNSYIVKPMESDQFAATVTSLVVYWAGLNVTPEAGPD